MKENKKKISSVNRERRHLLLAGINTVTYLVTGNLFSSTSSVAAPVHIQVPLIDQLTLRVLTDSYYNPFAQGYVSKNIKVEHSPLPLSKFVQPEKALLSEWGLSLYLESIIKTETQRTLLDFGYTSKTLINNLEILKVDLGKLNAMVLSHGHYDHFGGMAGFLKFYKNKLPNNLPLYVGGEEVFCPRETLTEETKSLGVINRQIIKDSNLQLIMSERPMLVGKQAFSPGHINDRSFEKVQSPTRMLIGKDPHESGCDPTLLDPSKQKQKALIDNFDHELALCFHLKGKGLIVITSCGHRGIINTIKQAQEIANTDKIYAIIGGFHLIPYDKAYVTEIVDIIAQYNPDIVIPMHCTGQSFFDIAKAKLGENKVIASYTGTQITFNA
jgi:7,8-dihydropterin-6-yl-methyl-4-(beta-D-ribofuranosyl)aminobenzene 5'-phosphate synthase